MFTALFTILVATSLSAEIPNTGLTDLTDKYNSIIEDVFISDSSKHNDVLNFTLYLKAKPSLSIMYIKEDETVLAELHLKEAYRYKSRDPWSIYFSVNKSHLNNSIIQLTFKDRHHTDRTSFTLNYILSNADIQNTSRTRQ